MKIIESPLLADIGCHEIFFGITERDAVDLKKRMRKYAVETDSPHQSPMFCSFAVNMQSLGLFNKCDLEPAMPHVKRAYEDLSLNPLNFSQEKLFFASDCKTLGLSFGSSLSQKFISQAYHFLSSATMFPKQLFSLTNLGIMDADKIEPFEKKFASEYPQYAVSMRLDDYAENVRDIRRLGIKGVDLDTSQISELKGLMLESKRIGQIRHFVKCAAALNDLGHLKTVGNYLQLPPLREFN